MATASKRKISDPHDRHCRWVASPGFPFWRSNVRPFWNRVGFAFKGCHAVKLGIIFASMLAFAGVAGQAQALTFTEDFEAPFPDWESGWFGVNSDARNVYCNGASGCAFRGNNPDGIWIGNTVVSSNPPSPVTVSFDPAFGARILSFSLDIATYTDTMLTVYDVNDSVIFSQSVSQTYGAWTDPGTYSNYTIASANGISSFAFSGAATGNTSIDNLVVEASLAAVPEPSALALLGAALLGFAVRRRAHRQGTPLNG
jgi:hypothetical protein